MNLNVKNYLKIRNILKKNNLPSHKEIFELTEKVSGILENEKTDYRQQAKDGSCGGLLSFPDDGLSLVVVPDLHARPYFLQNIIDYKIDGKSIFELLSESKIRVLCVGDILHTERNTWERWNAVKDEFESGIFTGPAISAEMQEGLSLLDGLLKLKQLFPKYFHILKGNHENIMNVTGGGDYAFRKCADEGQMVKTFVEEYYGDDILYLISCFEHALPLVACVKNCVVSHAEPRFAFTREQIINAKFTDGVIEGLTWTANDEAEEGTASAIIKNLLGSDSDECVYLAGHRPVSGNYRLRQNGKFIQIHNPSKQNIAIVQSDKKFNPENDIVEVKK